jgi:hypothetical protein
MDSFGKTRDPLLVHLHFPLSKTYRGLFYLSMLYHNSPKESIPLVFRLFLPALSGFWINRVQLLGDLGVYPQSREAAFQHARMGFEACAPFWELI